MSFARHFLHRKFVVAKSRIPVEVRTKLRTYLFRKPRLAWLVAHADARTRLSLPDRDTEIVIDGFPRSANSFSLVSFLSVNPEARVSNHLHSPLSVHGARRFGIPMIMMIRNPREAVRSYIQFVEGVTPVSAIRMYSGYYRAALPFIDDIVVADFQEVVTDFASVVERCNQKFGTSFALPGPAPQFASDVQVTIRDHWAGHPGTAVARQDDRRPAAAIIAEFDEQAIEALAEAERLYEHIVGRDHAT